jgi:hypothetical protein
MMLFEQTNSSISICPDSLYMLSQTKTNDFNIWEVYEPKANKYRLLSRSRNIILPVFRELRKTENESIKSQTDRLLQIIEGILNNLSKSKFDISIFPPLRPFFFDDGSFLFEFIFSDFRIGFSIEDNSSMSGWYLVTKENLGNINAQGYFENANVEKLILWLLSYVLTNT